MGIYSKFKTANDNSPATQRVSMRGDNLALLHSQDQETFSSQANDIPDTLPITPQKNIKAATASLKLALIFWAGAGLLILAAISLDTGAAFKTLASLSLLWTGIWTSYVSADHGWWRVSEISVVTALGGLMGGILTAATYFGLGLTFADGLMLTTILPLPIGYLLRSRICVLASICASLILASITIIGLVELSSFMIFMPIILTVQIIVATKIQSGMAITLAVITAYYWAGTLTFLGWSADNIPLTFAATALFAMGVAHHRSGKVSEDKKIAGSSIHIYTGWIAAMIGALAFQYLWITPEALQNETASLSAAGLGSWKALILASLTIIFCSSIIRYKHTQMSLPGIFLLTASAALLPLLLWFPSWPQNMVAIVPEINVTEAIGVLIGSAILAASIGMMLNGARRHSLVMMCLGMALLFAEAAILVRPNLITIDNIVILFTGGIAALAIGGLVAGSSLAHQAPAPRLKHS